MITAFLRLLFEVKKEMTQEAEDENFTTCLYWTYLFISLWKMVVYFGLMLAIIAVQHQVYQSEAYSVEDFFNKTDAAFQIHHFTGLQVGYLPFHLSILSVLSEINTYQKNFDGSVIELASPGSQATIWLLRLLYTIRYYDTVMKSFCEIHLNRQKTACTGT